MKKLYKFFWDCGRQGELEGLFIAEEQEVKNAIGKTAYFGEVLGKHSDVYGTIDDGEIEEVNVLQSTIDDLLNVLSSETISGFNPLEYIDDDFEEDEEDEDDEGEE